MTDNLRPERPRQPLMPPISGSPRQTHAALHTSAPSQAPLVSDEARFLEALPVIEDVTGKVCRRHRLNATEADEFRSDVHVHFIDRNYEVLRKFEGRCSLPTYITTIVQNLFFDYRNKMWQRYRPSVEAKRLGPTAMLIERLVVRDGLKIDEMIETLRVNHHITLDATHRAFCDTLSARGPSRRVVSDVDAVDIPSPGPSADDNVVKADRGFQAKRVLAALERARQALPPTGRLIVKMHFEDGAKVSDIARVLHLEQRPLYRTLERLLKSIGDAMAAEGISRADIAALLNVTTVEWLEDDEGPDTFVRTDRRAPWLRRR